MSRCHLITFLLSTSKTKKMDIYIVNSPKLDVIRMIFVSSLATLWWFKLVATITVLRQKLRNYLHQNSFCKREENTKYYDYILALFSMMTLARGVKPWIAVWCACGLVGRYCCKITAFSTDTSDRTRERVLWWTLCKLKLFWQHNQAQKSFYHHEAEKL